VGSQDKVEAVEERFTAWCVWKIVVPGAMLLLVWPVYAFVLSVKHPFQRAFAHGDLLIFAAMVLLEAAVEAEQVRRAGWLFRAGRQLAKAFAVIIIFLFGFIRYDVTVLDPELAHDSLGVVKKLTGYSCFNSSVALVAVMASLLSFWSSAGREKEELLERIGGGEEDRA
jgi:hypothetical protein